MRETGQRMQPSWNALLNQFKMKGATEGNDSITCSAAYYLKKYVGIRDNKIKL